MSKDEFHSLDAASDDALLVLFANGSPAAAQELTRRLMPRVFAQAYHKLRNRADAEDVTQDAFMKLWRIAPDWKQDQAKVSTWLYRVVENACIDRLRRNKSSAQLDDVGFEPADDRPSVSDQMQDKSRVDALYAAIDTLPERQAAALRMRHLEDRSNIEIAQILDLSVEAVESLVSRAKRTLTAQLRGQKTALGYQNDTL
ncbi:sigma-70 family RNA polymerase sigma factor [Rhodobacteraceae bacterium]|nr:sigma-70 family RNA polymerase sigma factor [Paracoccaceae bacterium]